MMRIAAVLVALATACSKPAKLEHASKIEWFEDAKFGMFVHWGPYAVGGVEASWPIMNADATDELLAAYQGFPARFHPTHFDPKAWVKLAKAAGQKYIVFTAKHHDGFAMFDADNMTDYKVTMTPYGRDVFAELARAAHAEGIRLGVYYSPPDMHHPGYRDTSRPPRENWKGQPERREWASYLDFMEQQLRQLLTRYGDIAVVWFDGLVDVVGDGTRYRGDRFFALIHRLQPDALINDRIGLPGDFQTPEQMIPDHDIPRPWETCMTINDSWAFNVSDLHFKAPRTLIWDLVDVVSRGGNFLLDVGPDADGVIQPAFEERLLAMGAWLRDNGDAIYGTRRGPRVTPETVRATRKPGVIYLHLLELPAEPGLVVDGISPAIRSAKLLADGRALPVHQTGTRVEVDVSAVPATTMVPVIALDVAR